MKRATPSGLLFHHSPAPSPKPRKNIVNNTDLILLLISPDFMASDYCYSKEMQRALERHKAGTCRVVPILLRPTFWEDAPFSSLQLLPTDARAITRWLDRDETFKA